jgi:CRP/FNR family cyclic AMP-dependent transcriptional regulator
MVGQRVDGVDASTCAALTSSSWFMSQPDDLRDRILEGAVLQTWPARSSIFLAKDPPDGIHALIAGSVRISAYPNCDEEAVLHIAEPGFWFGELAALGLRPRAVSATAVINTTLLHLPQMALERILCEHPPYARNFAGLLCDHLALVMGFMGELLAMPATARVAAKLATFAAAAPETGRSGSEIRISQADLAALVGLSRQRVNRILNLLAAGGAIEPGFARIVVRDTGRLRQLAFGAEEPVPHPTASDPH